MPARVLDDQVQRAPRPGEGRRGAYPREYRNQEGATHESRQNFQDWERRGAGQLHEYPVTTTEQRPFDYQRRPARAEQVGRPIHPRDRARLARQPLNDPGPIRAVTGQDQRVIGAMAHPEGNRRGYERAPLEPLDRQGRRDAVRYQDSRGYSDHNRTSSTWPPR